MSRLPAAGGAVGYLLLSALVPAASASLPVIGPAPAPPAQQPVDRNIVLNIQHRHIQEHDYRVSASVDAADRAHNLKVHLGGDLAASNINLVIVNLHGRVRFHGSLEQVTSVLNHHRAALTSVTSESPADASAGAPHEPAPPSGEGPRLNAPATAPLSTQPTGGKAP